jgi:hypothetical protein
MYSDIVWGRFTFPFEHLAYHLDRRPLQTSMILESGSAIISTVYEQRQSHVEDSVSLRGSLRIRSLGPDALGYPAGPSSSTMRSEDEIKHVARRQVRNQGIRIGKTVVASTRSCLLPKKKSFDFVPDG